MEVDLRVLIVDDSLVMRKRLTSYIEDMGYKVVGVASNGKDGISSVKTLRPDVITMDITMPDIDGISATKYIMANHPRSKIIMVTAVGQEDMVISALSAGAIGYVLKPIDKEKLSALLHDVMDKKYFE